MTASYANGLVVLPTAGLVVLALFCLALGLVGGLLLAAERAHDREKALSEEVDDLKADLADAREDLNLHVDLAVAAARQAAWRAGQAVGYRAGVEHGQDVYLALDAAAAGIDLQGDPQ